MFNLANVIPSYDESLAPVPRFCLANNCGRVVFPEPFQHELGFCNVCISQMQPRYNPLSLANDRINGDPSQIPIFTPSGEFPHKFHHNTFREAGGSNHVPHAPSESIMHPPIRHMPSSFYIQPPQSISHLQTLDSDWMRSTYITYQRLSDRNVLSNTGYPATGLPHGFTPQDRQPTLQLHPLNCEKCHVFMSNHLVGDGRVCSSCLFQHRAREPSVSTKSSSPLLNLDSFEHRDVIDLTGDDGDGLGHALMIGTGSAVQTLSAPPNRIEIRSPSSQRESSSDLSPPPKRQRIDEGVQNAFTESYKNDDQLATPAEGNILKICSTPSCDQTIPVESCGSRCISCVKIDWKSIKHRFKPSRPHHEREARNILPSALAKSTKPKCRKSVTWSDMVAVASEDGSIIQCLARDIEEDRLSASSCDNEQGGDGVNTPIAAHILDTIGHEKMDVVRSTDICLELEPRVETQEIRLAPPDKSIASTTGWDSDLSEISESDDGFSSDDSPQSSVPTGLTIRIPAPSSIVCSRKCKNPLCNQGLAPNYSGKTCIMCRVRGRQIQQRRKGLRDGEDITMLDDKPPKLIPDARLCSASECTHFIPPQQEYKFKRCSLCRLYQDKRRLRRRKSNHQYESTKPLADVKEIYNSFRFLPVRFPAPGRCPSLDCGLLHERGSTLCRQCVSRRSKLMKKAGIQEENRGVNVKQDKPSPELNIYPQYISHSFLVSDFEDRLKAFLQSQAVFFLFRMRSLVGTKALFSFDGEYSVVTVDSDVIGRKTEIDVRALKTKRDLEGIEGLRFTPKRLISVLDGGGVAIRFRCTYQASILRPRAGESSMAITEAMKPMTGELEIAVFPDHSHRCLPGEKTIIRFRLLG